MRRGGRKEEEEDDARGRGRSTMRTSSSSSSVSFADMGLSTQLVSRLVQLGVRSPTPVQRESIPRMLGCATSSSDESDESDGTAETDLALQAHTGSGKTLAFLLPVMHHILPPELGGVGPPLDVDAGLLAVIIAPSRDLAMQIVREARRIAGDDSIGGQLIAQGVGGANIQYQIDALKRSAKREGKKMKRKNMKKRVDIGVDGDGDEETHAALPAPRPAPRCIVGTPGRLRELSKRGVLQTHESHVLIIDEADKMLKDVFYKDIVSVAKHVGKKRDEGSGEDAHSEPTPTMMMTTTAATDTDTDEDDDVDDDGVYIATGMSGEFTVTSTGNDIVEYMAQNVNVVVATDDDDENLDVDIEGIDEDEGSDESRDDDGATQDQDINMSASARRDVPYPHFPNLPRRQTVLVSATMTPRVLKQFDSLVVNPLLIRADDDTHKGADVVSRDGFETHTKRGYSAPPAIRDLSASIAPGVEHLVLETTTRQHHVDCVRRAIHALGARRVLVFMNNVKPLKDTAAKLNARGGIHATWISGDTPKVERANALARFRDMRAILETSAAGSGNSAPETEDETDFEATKSGSWERRKKKKKNVKDDLRVLVVNDLVAHGLDFPGCDLVVNLELPSDAAHYAHRAGRTGRLGALGGAGVVLSIVLRDVNAFVVRDKFARELDIDIKVAEVGRGNLTVDGGKRTVSVPLLIADAQAQSRV